MHRLTVISKIAFLVAVSCAHSEELNELPVYAGNNDQFGEIRIWGNQTMTNLLRLWEVGIMQNGQRGLRFSDTLPSGSAAIGPLYTGVADLGVMGHHIWPIEVEAFYQVFGYEPLEIIVATGSYDIPAKMPANVIFVHRDNPLSNLTLQQVDGIFGEQRSGGWQGRKWTTAGSRSHEENIRTWGQLGLTGKWTDQPIRVHGYDLTGNSFVLSMQRLVFQGGGKWNPSLQEHVLNEVALLYSAGPRPKQGCDVLMDALANDPYAIAYSAMQCGRRNPNVKYIALAKTEGAPYVLPTMDSYLDRAYPLVESIYVYVNRPPGLPVEPKVKEFLKYVLSRQGQEAVVSDGGYLPLPASVVRAQLRKLE